MAFDPKKFAVAEAKRQGVPPWVILAMGSRESGWDQTAVSPVGAQGYLQLMPGTARELGINPRDPKQNIIGGIRYFKQQLTRFGTIPLALAAYNAGPGRVEDGSWRRISETSRYVDSIMKAQGKQHKAAAATTAAKPMPPGAGGNLVTAATSPVASPLTGPPGASLVEQTAFSNLGKIAQGVDPTETLGDLVTAATTPEPVAPPAAAPVVPVDAPSLEPMPMTGKPPAAGKGGKLVMPLKTKMTSGSEFGMVDAEGAPSRNGNRYHAAKDWFAPAGTAVVAPIGGRIIEAKVNSKSSGQVFGGTVKVQAADGKVYVFRHTNPYGVRVGERVRAGETIGRVAPWRGGSPHSHVEIWKTLEGGYTYENMLDPSRVFGR